MSILSGRQLPEISTSFDDCNYRAAFQVPPGRRDLLAQ
jgi:hypothetical protein